MSMLETMNVHRYNFCFFLLLTMHYCGVAVVVIETEHIFLICFSPLSEIISSILFLFKFISKQLFHYRYSIYARH